MGDPLGQEAGVRHRDDSVARSVEDEGWPGYGCRWDADNQVFVVACNMTGQPFCGSSLIVDPRGDILAQAGVGVETIAATLESDTMAAERAREPSSAASSRALRVDRWPGRHRPHTASAVSMAYMGRTVAESQRSPPLPAVRLSSNTTRPGLVLRSLR